MNAYRRVFSLALITVLALSFFGSTATSAAGSDPGTAVPAPSKFPAHERPSGTGLTAAQLASQTAQRKGTIDIFIQLNDPSAADRHAASGSSSSLAQSGNLSAYKAAIVQGQNAFAATLSSTGIGYKEIRRLQTAINGIQIQVDASKVAQIAALPGIKTIFYDHEYYLDNLKVSVPLIGAPTAWSAGPGITGTGIKIGIIDTGIDYRHADFGGNGSNTFPTAKVVGGNNFVTGDGSTPGDPLDFCDGHGTNVAGIAAGFGVLNAGPATYTGAYTSALDFSQFLIGPGVAPQALLYAYRVFGCPAAGASSFSIAAAIDQAINDGVNVINMSLGANYGSDQDLTSLATVSAGYAGVSVAIAAGNAGDTHFVAGSPAAAPNAITVAASQDAGVTLGQVKQTVPSSATYVAAPQGFGPALTAGGVTANVLYAKDSTGSYLGCKSFAAGTFTNQIALIDRGSCSGKTKVANAQIAGAVGVILVNNTSGPPVGLSDDPTVTTVITIPAVMVSIVDGGTIKTKLTTGTVTVTIQIATGSAADTLASFSSRGPSTNLLEGVQLKPDIAAPGVNMDSARFNTVAGVLSESGTSQATPHITGVMALLKQLHPGWTTAELKALAMNTAAHDVFNDAAHTIKNAPMRIGAGRVDLAYATASDANVIAYNANDPRLVSVSFGVVDTLGSTTLKRTVVVTNKGAASASYNVNYLSYTSVPGTTVTTSPATITLAAGASQTVTVTLTANPNAQAQPHVHDPTMFETQANGIPRAWMSEQSGYLDLTPMAGSTKELRVPIYAIIRPDSAMKAATNPLITTARAGSTHIALTGTPLNTGANPPYDVTSLVTPFELVATGTGNSLAPAYRYGSIQYVGYTSDIKANAGDLSKTEMFFGLSTYNNWTTPSILGTQINITANGTNYALINIPLNANTDVFVTELINLSSGATTIEDVLNYLPPNLADTNPFNTNVMVLPVFSKDLGLTAGNAMITYSVQTYEAIDNGQLIDQTPTLTYNVEKPVYDFTDYSSNCTQPCTGMPYQFDLPTSTIPVAYDLAAASSPAAPPSILLVHLHNSSPLNRAEVVPVQASPAGLSQTVGIYRPSNNTFYLKNTNTTGYADITFQFGTGSQLYPVAGDWLGSGIDSVGVYDQTNGLFSLRNTNSAGAADEQLVVGYPGDQPIAGRWVSGVTHSGVGVFRPSNGLIYLKKDLASGYADFTMVLGIPGDVGIAGDWNGDGIASPGVYRPPLQTFYLSNQVVNGPVTGDYTVQLGNPGDTPFAGDWTGTGHTGLGVFRPTNGQIYLKNDPTTAGYADNAFIFGNPNDIPIAGHWANGARPPAALDLIVRPAVVPTSNPTAAPSVRVTAPPAGFDG